MPSNILELCVGLRKALQRLDLHFASNRRQVVSFLNAQPLCIETWVRVNSLKIVLTMVPWPKIDALRTFIFYEVSTVGKTPRGRKLQSPDRCRLKIIKSWIFPLFKAEKKYDRSSNLNYILLIFIPKKYFLTELSYQYLGEKLSQIIYPKNVPMEISWFFMFYLINVRHILKLWDFWKRYFTAANDWKQTKKSYCETALLTRDKIKRCTK